MSNQTYLHEFYLAFRKKQRGWNSLRVRVTDRLPSLESGEVAIKVTARLPQSLFQRPMLTAAITVPVDSVTPATVSAEVADNIAEIVRQQIGVDLHITIAAPEIAE